jgi:hypothetical protein
LANWTLIATRATFDGRVDTLELPISVERKMPGADLLTPARVEERGVRSA